MFLKYLCYHSICLLISITVADENTAKMSTQATSFACRSIIFIFTLPCENYNMNGLQHSQSTELQLETCPIASAALLRF